MTTEATDVQGLMKSCQRGVAGKGQAIEAANNLLAECYGLLGKLAAENEALRKDAERYRVLRQADLDTIHNGGLFAGLTPDNIVINGHDLDRRADAVIAANKEVQR
ncbi:hypothetical protein [Pseudomonas putida]|uniref:Uncharacterized protein n=1 Tax=Pseudomonas putida TaxID=303 RepID=A0AAW4C185_PSEPU|nr:hypothetical protein [Pseudomonas putida]MBF8703058.1 hypothetical protein [Pseudomonas putida]MBF8736914.1 hypothetical protein [Pseudomonas putida]